MEDVEDQERADRFAKTLDRIWAKFLPEILERVTVLERAAVAFDAHKLTASQQEAAHDAAHKLAGVLGTFNLARCTGLARELEVAYGGKEGPDPALSPRLAAITIELRAIIEGRE